jgi:hypothetical protein
MQPKDNVVSVHLQLMFSELSECLATRDSTRLRNLSNSLELLSNALPFLARACSTLVVEVEALSWLAANQSESDSESRKTPITSTQP